MNSSISRFRNFALFALFTAVVAAGLGYLYLLFGNPEVKFWCQALVIKNKHAEELHQQGLRRTFFVGGSSTAFQIDAGLLEREFNIPSVNFGLHYGLGIEALVYIATQATTPGDRIVLMMEPSVFSEEFSTIPNLGNQMLLALGKGNDPKGFAYSGTRMFGAQSVLSATRPGLYHLATMSAKVLAREPLFRYDMADVDRNGSIVTNLRYSFILADYAAPITISPYATRYLTELTQWAVKNQIEIVYMLPVVLTDINVAEQQAAYNELYLTEMAEFMPVIRDDCRGISSEINLFADTPMHMTATGAIHRTRSLGKVLRQWIDKS
jgi:hypothetical protein